MLLLFPIVNISFMPREVMGIHGLNIGNIVWLSAFVMAVFSITSRKGNLRFSSYLSLPVMLFLFMYLIAVIWTMFNLDAIQRPGHGITTKSLIMEDLLKPLQLLLAGWIVMVYCEVEGNTVRIQRVVFIIPLIIVPIVMYYYFQGSIGTDYVSGRDEISDLFGYHANELGAVGTYLLAFALITKEQRMHLLRYLSIGASLMIIVLSFSRMAYLTTLALIVLTFFKLKHKERLVLVSLTGVVIIVFSVQLMSRLYFGIDTSRKKVDINQISANRIDKIWRPMIPHFLDHMIFGDGVYSVLKTPEARVWMPSHPHNAYLQVALDMGVLGVAALLWLLARFLSLGRRTQTAFLYVVISWMLMGFTGSSFYPTHANFIVWISYGIALSVRREKLYKLAQADKPEFG